MFQVIKKVDLVPVYNAWGLEFNIQHCIKWVRRVSEVHFLNPWEAGQEDPKFKDNLCSTVSSKSSRAHQVLSEKKIKNIWVSFLVWTLPMKLAGTDLYNNSNYSRHFFPKSRINILEFFSVWDHKDNFRHKIHFSSYLFNFNFRNKY